jgi:hypothetical protein
MRWISALTEVNVPRGAVPLVVVGAFLGQPEVDRQQRLGAVHRMDLGLLVDDSTTAPPGGSRYKPMTSATFAANAGSLDRLSVPCRTAASRGPATASPRIARTP